MTSELGFGLKGSVSAGPVKATAGLSLHDEKTFTSKDRNLKDAFTSGSPVTDKLEGDIGFKVGPIGGIVEGGYVHTGGDDVPIDRYGPKPEGTAEEQGLGEVSANREEVSSSLKGYFIIGGGVTFSVDQKALFNVVTDIPGAAESLRKEFF